MTDRCNLEAFGVTFEPRLHHRLHAVILWNTTYYGVMCNPDNLNSYSTHGKPKTMLQYIYIYNNNVQGYQGYTKQRSCLSGNGLRRVTLHERVTPRLHTGYTPNEERE